MRFLFFVCLFTGLFLQAGGIENFRAGGRSLALSDACISVPDLWSSFHNQAGIAGSDQIIAGVFYESKFYLKELSTVAGAAIIPTSTGNFSFSFIQFGRKSYKEEKLGLAFAKNLGQKIKAGIQFDYFLLSLPENERAKGFATVEGGVIYSPGHECSVGAHVFNPVGGGIHYPAGKEKVPASFTLGGHYLFNESLMVCLAGEKETGHPACLKTGVEFNLMGALSFRFGISGKPFRYTTGLGYKAGNLSVDIGFSHHNALGMTPSVSLQYGFR